MRQEEIVAKSLINTRKTIAVAESCTGGLLAHRLTNIPGSSAFLAAGIVAYSNDVKSGILKIPSSLLKRYGAVSTQTASAMARNIRKLLKTDYGVGISGIAGPAGGSRSKPVGLVFIAVSSREEALCLECRFRGSRARIKSQAATQALKLLQEFL